MIKLSDMFIVCIVGLTIGLVSIDKNELKLMIVNGTPEQKLQAARYYLNI